MRMNALPNAVRTRFMIWGVLMLGLLAVFALRVLPHVKVETDILALLPNTQQDAAMDDALTAFSAKLARRQIFLIGATDLADAKRRRLHGRVGRGRFFRRHRNAPGC